MKSLQLFEIGNKMEFKENVRFVADTNQVRDVFNQLLEAILEAGDTHLLSDM